MPLGVPVCLALRMLRAHFTDCRTALWFLSQCMAECFLPFPEHAGKVSEGVKPFVPAKTTRKKNPSVVSSSLSLAGVDFEGLGEELGLEIETAL